MLNGIAAVLPRFVAQRSGHVVNVASIAAHMVMPTAAVYCASKHAVWAITDGLRQAQSAEEVVELVQGVVSLDSAPQGGAAATPPPAATAPAAAVPLAMPEPDRRVVEAVLDGLLRL